MSHATLRALLLFAALAPAPPAVTGRATANEPELVFTGSTLKEETQRVRVELGAPAAGLQRKNLAVGPGGRFRAFTVEDPSKPGGFFDRIFFEDVRAGRTYEIRNLLNAHRPFNDLRFHRAVLQFDRWAGPHTGIRYRLDVRRRRLVSARTFIEADYLRLMKCSQTPGCQPDKQR
jgi:hypothetical protein